jgi:hypothetical protein
MTSQEANQKVGSGLFFLEGKRGSRAWRRFNAQHEPAASNARQTAKRVTRLFLRNLLQVALICALANSVRFAQSSLRAAPRAAWNQPASVTWSGAQLREAVLRFANAQSLEVLIDRRVDPSAPVAFTADRVPAGEIIRAAAEKSGAHFTLLDGVAYIGPAAASKQLATASALRAQDAQRAKPELRKKLLTSAAWKWDDFAEPRELLKELATDVSLEVVGAEQIPHDLWAAAKLPPLTLSDRLTLLLHQFDLTYRLGDDGASIILEPLPERVFIERDYAAGAKPEERLAEWRAKAPEAAMELRGKRIVVRGTVEEHAALAAPEKTPTRTPESRPGNEVYTLKVNGEPLNKVLPPLAKQLRLELVIDEEGITAQGIPLDRRVTFEVKEASLQELMDAVFAGTQLAWRVEDGKLTVNAP